MTIHRLYASAMYASLWFCIEMFLKNIKIIILFLSKCKEKMTKNVQMYDKENKT